MRRPAYLLATTLLALATLTPAQGAGPAPRFDWPDGLVMEVSVRIEGGRRDGKAETASWDLRGSSRWTVRRDGGRTFVSRSAFSGWDGKQPPAGGDLTNRLVEYVPRLVVGKDGEFLGIEGTDAERARIVASFPDLRSEDAIVRALAEASVRDDALQSMTEDLWSVLVGIWLQAGPAIHEGYRFSTRVSVPQFGGAELDIRGVASLESTAECVRGGKTRRCATLKFRSSADQEQVKAILEQVIDPTGKAGIRWIGFDQVREFLLVAELDTLVPHRMTIRSQSLIEAEFEGQREKLVESTTKEYRVAHVAPAPPPATSAD